MTQYRTVDSIKLGQAVRNACLLELRALKPGNVHVHAPGHGMTAADFDTSAETIAKVLALPGLTVGERILQAVKETRGSVGCNTNLGIILLSAPLAQAALLESSGGLKQRLVHVMAALDRNDAEHAFRAILLANPAGLGRAEHHDVRAAPKVTLLEAMIEAARRDLIARQYATNFEDIFSFGIPLFDEALARWGDDEWATTRLFLSYLSRFPDSHVVRKFGFERAEMLRQRAEPYERKVASSAWPAENKDALLAFDESLKTEGLNPGTSADLTVATILARKLDALLDTDDRSIRPALRS